MPASPLSRLLVTTAMIVCCAARAKADEVDFNRDIRAILSENCFACHGFDKNAREADLRLDTREGATTEVDGRAAIIPGEPDRSELIARVTSTDSDVIMPPADSQKKPLDAKSIAKLTDWIRQGAPWGKHWAFEKPQKADTPADQPHPVDYFVGKKLAANGLTFAPQAATHTLVRRLSFDLTGLPPDADDLATHVADPSREAWDALIDRLLASPHFGERMAMWWLDGARYSDTDGFQSDSTRANWPWRDWVTDAFNNNMSFDQFTIEQFAGDLLPNATPEQHLATCFHRNHMTNGEGGRDPEESRVDYVLDRVNTTGTVFLGLTLSCTQCHEHKFDPISQADYYSLSAYFNSIDEDGRAGGGAKPYLEYVSPYAKRAVAEETALLKQSQTQLDKLRESVSVSFEEWLQARIEETASRTSQWVPIQAASLRTVEGTLLAKAADSIVQASNSQFQDDYVVAAEPTGLPRITGIKLEVLPHQSHTGGKLAASDDGEFILTNFQLRIRTSASSQVRDVSLVSAVSDFDGKGKDSKYSSVRGTLDDDPRTGWTTRGKPGDTPHVAVFALEEPLVLAADETLEIVLMHRSLFARSNIGRFRLSASDQAGQAVRSIGTAPIEELAKLRASIAPKQLATGDVSESLRKKLLDQFLEDNAEWKRLTAWHSRIAAQLNSAKSASGKQKVMVLAQRTEPRRTHILVRGIWNKHGQEVVPAVLPAVTPIDAATVPTRLELAKWIVSRDNPLTARVITNQIWQLFFGAGLVRTPSDFGQQGQLPTHPDLLDWLAVDFMEHGWDVKHLVRVIVTSNTYRQDSSVTAEMYERDPGNRLLGRGARFRLPSWMIRDAALKSSGLLNPALGGPPVYPYQPVGVWRDQFMGRFTYQPSIGPAQYRRTLYAFWRRTSAPTFLFDSAMRRSCEVTPRRTNSPLHALTLLNDTTSLEAARTLADLVVDAAPDDQRKRIAMMCVRVLSRGPGQAELAVLMREHERAVSFYEEHRDEAAKFVKVGQLSQPPTDDVAEVAATMLIANTLLNLDEAITHE